MGVCRFFKGRAEFLRMEEKVKKKSKKYTQSQKGKSLLLPTPGDAHEGNMENVCGKWLLTTSIWWQSSKKSKKFYHFTKTFFVFLKLFGFLVQSALKFG